MALKIPPPPPIATNDPTFNRWLLEITSLLAASGGVDPTQIPGYSALQAQVAANTASISGLTTTTGGQSTQLTIIQLEIAALNTSIATINGQLTTLGARAQVLNGVGVPAAGLGNINDWYANIGGGVGARIYVKTGAATWTAFPF